MIETAKDLKDARRTMGLSTYAMADMLRLGPTTEKGAASLREMENGKRRLTGPICQLADALLSGWRPANGDGQ